MGFFYALTHPSPRGKVRWMVVLVVVLFLTSAVYGGGEFYNANRDAMNNSLHGVSFLKWLTLPPIPARNFRLGLDLKGGTHLVYDANVSQIPPADRDSSLEGVRDVIERRVNAFGVAEPIVQTVKTGDAYRVIVELAGVSDVSQAITMIGETPLLEFKEEGTPEISADQQKEMEDYNKKADAHAADLLAKATAPNADFEALARGFSEDVASKEKGGDIGWVSKYTPQYGNLSTPAAQTKVGSVSAGLLSQPNGQEIIKVLETRVTKEVSAKHILVCFKGAKSCDKETSKEDARKQIEDIKKQANKDNFSDLAKQYSTDPSAKENGGDLGFFGPGMMLKAFEDAAFAMQKDTVSDIVETDFGFHLIYKTDEKPLAEYHLKHILVKKKTSQDYLSPDNQWKQTGLTGKQLAKAFVTVNQNTQLPEVSLEFNDEGKKLFGDITERNVNKMVAIFLDGKPISTPRVSQPIKDGQAVIQGNFTPKEAKSLAQLLSAGALPVPINLVSQQTVGASLGGESLQKSLAAGAIGFLLVALFMIGFYRLPGLLAVVALGIYTVLTLAVFKLGNMTLSLSGIAGFILSVGMAVDANILIFERMKEEVRSGKGLEGAIRDGFARAWTSIRDSNVSSLITCFILFWFSASLIKGFALTLAIGILVSMFSAIYITRIILRLVAGWGIGKKTWLFVPTKKREVSNIGIIQKRGIWLSVSGLMVVIAVVGLFMHGLKFGIDFTGGSLMEVEYAANRPSSDDVRKVFESHDVKDAEIRSTGDKGMIFRFKTISEDEHKKIVEDLKKQGDLTEKDFNSIGPVIGQELRDKSWKAAFIALLAIFLYVAYAFRKVSRPVASWKYGLTTVFALFHDLLVLVGVFAFLGYFMGVEINSSFIAAFLTVLGFSVHDTIVVFDRVRENLLKYTGSFGEIVNKSLNETIIRSINTSFTVLLTLLAIHFFGGESLKDFSLALLVGIAAGTYSSIFVASPLLVVWQTKKFTGHKGE